jgi:hypothetical protein
MEGSVRDVPVIQSLTSVEVTFIEVDPPQRFAYAIESQKFGNGAFPSSEQNLVGLGRPQELIILLQRIVAFKLGFMYQLGLNWIELLDIKRSLGVPFMMDIIILMSWCIWKERNSWLFNGEDPSVSRCKVMFKQEFTMVIHRAKSSRTSDMEQWLHNLV